MKKKHNEVPGKEILAHLRSEIFKIFRGSMPPDPLAGLKNFFSLLCGDHNFLGLQLKSVKFWAGPEGLDLGLDPPLNIKAMGPLKINIIQPGPGYTPSEQPVHLVICDLICFK